MSKRPAGKVRPRLKRQRQRIYLREWRKHRNKTQIQLAEALGVRAATVSRIETGDRQYTQEFLEAAAEYLETYAPSLLMRDPTDPDGIWSIWDRVSPADRPVALQQLQALAQRKRA